MKPTKFLSIIQLLIFTFVREFRNANSTPDSNLPGHALDSPRTSSSSSSTSEYLSASSSPLRNLLEYDVDAPKTSLSNLPEHALDAPKASSSNFPVPVADDAHTASLSKSFQPASQPPRHASKVHLTSSSNLSKQNIDALGSKHADNVPKTSSKRITNDVVSSSLSSTFTRKFQVTSSESPGSHPKKAPRTSSSKRPESVIDAPRASSSKNRIIGRIEMVDVSRFSSIFLSDVKMLPYVHIGKFVHGLQLEEPPAEDRVMNAARKAIGETDDKMEATKKKLVALLKRDQKLNTPWENAAWLIRFLRARQYDVDETYKLIKDYYEFKVKNGNVYDKLVPSKERHVAEYELNVLLPTRDQLGRRIFLSRTKNWNLDKHTLVHQCRVGVVIMETTIYEPASQLAGVQIVFDLDKLSWSHIWKFSVTTARKMVEWLLDSAPFKYAGIHIVNQPGIFSALYNLFKPFLTPELKKKIHFHGKNMKSLHEHILPDFLPDTYGGSYPMPSLSSQEWDVVLKSMDEEYESK